MSGYHNIVLPGQFAVGSTHSVEFDTRITRLESGAEQRLTRSAPYGRRRYNLLRGIVTRETVLSLLEFYVARQGALNSFKFLDPLDHSTSSTRTSATAVTRTDSDLTWISARSYQLTTTYTDAASTIVRPLTKIVPGSEVVSANGASTTDYTLDDETGILTYGAALGTITQASAGCQFYTVCRFGDATDEAFTIAMQAAEGMHALPGFELVEDISASVVSQDFPYGGHYNWGTITADIVTSERRGRVQTFHTTTAGLSVRLPSTLDLPTGGPYFVFANDVTSTQSVDIESAIAATLTTLAAGEVVEVYLAETASGKFWLGIKGA